MAATKKITELAELLGANVDSDNDVLAIVDLNESETKRIKAGELVDTLLAKNNTWTGEQTFSTAQYSSTSRNISTLYDLTDKKYVDEAVTALGARYYMLDTASGVSAYKLTSLNASSGPEDSVSATGWRVYCWLGQPKCRRTFQVVGRCLQLAHIRRENWWE